MSKTEIVLSADIHCFQHKKSTDRLNDCLEALRWVFQTAIANDVPNVAVLGDLFHHRYSIHVPTYQLVYEVLREYAGEKGLKVWLLVGNHDMWFHEKRNISSIIPLQSIPNVTVINEPCTVDVGDYPASFLPYTANPAEDLKQIVPASGFKLLLGHVAVDGAILNAHAHTFSDVYVEQDGDMAKVTEGVFMGWNKVFLGHYHTPQVLNPVVEYVGSPLELCFSDTGQQKHVVIYDMKDHTQRYVDNSFSPKHIVSKKEDLGQHNLNRAYLALVSSDLTTPEFEDTCRDLMQNHALRDVVVAPMKKVTKEETDFFQGSDAVKGNELQVTEKYIEWAEKQGKLEGLKKAKLLRMVNQVVQEVA